MRCIKLLSAVVAAGQILGGAPLQQRDEGGALKFEVASVKTNKAGSAGGEGRTRENIQVSPGSLIMTNVSMSSCIQWAYSLRDFQINGGPTWLPSERYDIAAKASGPASAEQLRLMLQALLADRFQLSSHKMMKELPVYALVKTKNGAKLRAAAGDGASSMRPSERGLTFLNFSMDEFANRLPSRPLSVDRPVLDKTGLEGSYDFNLNLADNAADVKSTLEGMERGRGPSIFTVIQEQLGLRLEPQKGPVEILVIDHLEKVATAN